MSRKEKKPIDEDKEKGEISRREFLKDAGLVVGGAAIGSTVLLAACGDGEVTTETVTQTQTQTQTATETVTTTQQVGAVTETVTETVSTFICPYDSQEFDTLAALKAHVEAEHPGAPVPAENIINATVNGWEYALQVEPESTLREVLREKLGLISIKDMCTGQGACGSCTVIVDGRPILSCMTLAIECGGKTIETAEGLAAANHPLIDAYVMNHCMQCGYCTPGFVLTSKALLDRNPNPTEEEIRDALAGNLCRCTTYPRHPIAVLEAAESLQGG